MAIALSLSLGLSLAPSVAFADAYDSTMARAIAAREKAVDSNDPASWQEALSLFEEADSLRATKDSKYELANAATHLRQDDVAVEAYEAAIALGLSGKAKDKAQAFLDANAPKMARLMLIGPSGARVVIDGVKRGSLPLAQPIVVFAGKIHVSLIGVGGFAVDEDVATKAGQSQTEDWSHRFDAPGKTDLKPKPDDKDHDADDRPVPIDDHGASTRSLGWTLVAAGGATAAVSLGVVLLGSVTISSHRSALADECLTPDGDDACRFAKVGKTADAQSDTDAIATWKGVRTIGYVGAGVGVVLMGVGALRLLTAPPTQRTSAWATPTIGATLGGMTVGVTGGF